MITRRRFLGATGAAALTPLLPAPGPLWSADASEPEAGFSFSAAEEATLRAAADRLIPPYDNTQYSPDSGISFRGAGQEGAYEYVLQLLTAFDHDPPRIHPAGRESDADPQSFGQPIGSSDTHPECHGGHQSIAGRWLVLPPEKEIGWRAAIARMQQAYRGGLALLESDAQVTFGRGFVTLSGLEQTLLLQRWDGANAGPRLFAVYSAGGGEAALEALYSAPADPRGAFFNMLHTHVMEAVYGDPVYGGNRSREERIGWRLAGFGGPRHPQGYSPGELETPAACDHGVPFNAKLPENLG